MIWLLTALAAETAPAPTAPAPSPMVDALVAEMERAGELSLADAPPLYHLRYHLAEIEQRELRAAFGSLLRQDEEPFNGLGIELRVGEASYDNTGFGGWENGFVRTGLADELTPLELRQSAWLLTDTAYKQAVEQYARKRSQFNAPPDYPGDYTTMPAIQVDGGTRQLGSADLEARLVRLSKLFRTHGDKLMLGELELGEEAGHVWMLDTEGNRIRRPLAETTVRATVSGRTKDGVLLTDSRLYSAQTASQLPDESTMVLELTAMRDALVARLDSERLEDEYVGPVIFEDAAAIDLARYLLVPQVEGTPPEIPFDSFFGELGDDRPTVRIGRRVLPEGWTVVEDPTANPDHPSHYTYDWEGVKTGAKTLVEDGIVGDLLLSRVPRKDLTVGGHARGFLGERANGRAAQLTVSPDKRKSTAALRKRALKMARAYGRDHVYVVRRLQEPSVLARHGSAARQLLGGDDRARLPPPVELLKVYADGRQVVVHGARFAFSDRFILRDIAMAGPERTGTFLAPFAGSYLYLGPTEGLPTLVTAPDVLVREIELAPTGADPRDAPVLLPPE